MPRAKEYLDIDVVTAARQRVQHIYDIFDNTTVMFSGGKDSLVTLHLVKEFHDQFNLGPVTAVFRHEETINFSVVEFMKGFRNLDWLNLYWMCIPTMNDKFVMGKREEFVEWDPNREWVQERPEWAITADDLGVPSDGSVDQHSVDDVVSRYLGQKGKVAHITGVRASESLVRFRAVTQKLNENYISSIEGNTRSRVKLCKPIYDWEVEDVLKYLYERDIEWCPLYDVQELAGMGLRVSTALHVAAAKKLDKLAVVEPEFYQELARKFPDIQDQRRYWQDYDKDHIFNTYGPEGFAGARRYVKENMSPEDAKLARKRIALWEMRNKKDPENYPLDLLFKHLESGILDHMLAGKYVNSKAEKKKRANSEAPSR